MWGARVSYTLRNLVLVKLVPFDVTINVWCSLFYVTNETIKGIYVVSKPKVHCMYLHTHCLNVVNYSNRTYSYVDMKLLLQIMLTYTLLIIDV